jgi:hypothetical protein
MPMAFKVAYEITCSCGVTFTADLVDYVFTEYDPELKEAILSDDFNSVICPSCRESLNIENRFLYRDEKNKLWVWVCKKEDEPQRDQLVEELLEKSTYIKDHHLDDKEDYRKLLVFGRDELIELLLQEDQILKRTEGRQLKSSPAYRLIMETGENPGFFFLSGRKIRVSIPLRFFDDCEDLLTGPEERKRWLRYYSKGLNIHNPYSSFLNKRLKTKWQKIREAEPLNDALNEYEDFAESWARYRMDLKRFKVQAPQRLAFFNDLKKVKITRKLRSINPRVFAGGSD